MRTIESDRCGATRGASGHCIISIANFDKLSVLDAIRKYKRSVCKSLLSVGHLHGLLGVAYKIQLSTSRYLIIFHCCKLNIINVLNSLPYMMNSVHFSYAIQLGLYKDLGRYILSAFMLLCLQSKHHNVCTGWRTSR